MTNNPNHICISGSQFQLIFDCKHPQPRLLYWGPRTEEPSIEDLDSLRAACFRQEAPCAPAEEVAISTIPLVSQGFHGAPAAELSSSNQAWAFNPQLESIQQTNAHSVVFALSDPTRHISLKQFIEIDTQSDVVSFRSELRNNGADALHVLWLASATVPIAAQLNWLTSFEGRWAKEFQLSRFERKHASYVRENRRGKTSHDLFPGLIAHNQSSNESQGEALGFHLGASGNHRLRVDSLEDGRAYFQAGELLLPGERVLEQGDTYSTPTLFATASEEGFNGLSHNFHQFVRTNLLRDKVTSSARPIHYNTWEAVYFDHDPKELEILAEKAADLGVERFVLDDGWFPGRRNDKAGLGDWVVDTRIYPDGLAPLIKRVNDLGLEFGLWFEPEMVNPDSELFRLHPDWVLRVDGAEQLSFRHQYVLDLTNPKVCAYLFESLSSILKAYPQITYIKWDMNRDLSHPGAGDGAPAVSRQVDALYALIEKIRAQYPSIEIESCASGGGRADYGILQHTDRVWTSDSNDALDRLDIQRGFSYFFPAELMGAHVGPRDCHITGRRVSCDMRAAVALFGHMGMEMDPRELNDDEVNCLKNAFTLYKQYRSLIHSGRLYRIDGSDYERSFMIVDQTQTQALLSYNVVNGHNTSVPATLKPLGLDEGARYKVSLIWPNAPKQKNESALNQFDGKVFNGKMLMWAGLQMPLLDPQSALIFHLEKQ